MTPETWEKVDELFNTVVDLSPDERDAYFRSQKVDTHVREQVERMIAADLESAQFLEESVATSFSRPPDRIGNWTIISEIGKGGMGTVFLAENPNLGQRAALKIIRAGIDSKMIVRRFEHERRILATLEHPNIARLIDGGTTSDGRPFYAMEYVEGLPLDEYCRGRSVREILGIFRQICRAVAYAHARLIVHRDLKPSNIIVGSDGTAKLLDFGIAKLLSADSTEDRAGTATSLGMMTPDYASPEQIRGERVTTASDIYSLGVVLYRLLTGRLPHNLRDKTLDKVLAIMSDEIPRPPSSIVSGNNEIRSNGDLDNIVLKALRKEPDRRYATSADFGDDIRRFLEGLPVTARPSTFRYRAVKFAGRNRASVIASVLVVLSLIAGISIATWQAVVARRQKALAEKRFADVRELANKVVFRYHDEIAKFPGATALREELVRDAVQYLDSLNTDEIDDKALKIELARAYVKVGDVQGRPYTANLGRSEDALASYLKSIAILERAVEKAPSDLELKQELVHSLIRLVPLKARLAQKVASEIDRAVALQLEINAASSPGDWQKAAELADVFVMRADHSQLPVRERIEVYREALALLESIPDKSLEVQHAVTRVDQRLGTNYGWLGDELKKNGDVESAIASYRAALPYHEQMFESLRAEIQLTGGSQNLRRLEGGSYVNLGETYMKLGMRDKTFEYFAKNLEIVTELLNADEKNVEALTDVADAHGSFSRAYEEFGEIPAAIDSSRRSIAFFERAFSVDAKNLESFRGIVIELDHLANLLVRANRTSDGRATVARIKTLCADPSNSKSCYGLKNFQWQSAN